MNAVPASLFSWKFCSSVVYCSSSALRSASIFGFVELFFSTYCLFVIKLIGWREGRLRIPADLNKLHIKFHVLLAAVQRPLYRSNWWKLTVPVASWTQIILENEPPLQKRQRLNKPSLCGDGRLRGDGGRAQGRGVNKSVSISSWTPCVSVAVSG